ncbi:MAG: HPr family phosphocarrier protein, partial [Aldersonia sp.]|nr:HPr family phosphocarrier protein [Aldersonia sp.]
VEIRNLSSGSAWADAASLTAVATLGIRCGDEVAVRARGAAADAAVRDVVALARRGFEQTGTVSASAGVASGPARLLRVEPTVVPDGPAADVTAERRRLHEAIATVRRDLTALRDRIAGTLGAEAAQIFDAHLVLLDDRALLDRARARIEQGDNVVAAWSVVIAEVADEFGALTDPYLRARGDDIAAIGDQVLRTLCGMSPIDIPHSGVLVAADLTPAQAAACVAADVRAVLLAAGDPLGHAAILLRSARIPAVFGAGPAVLDIPDGTPIEIDATHATFTTA